MCTLYKITTSASAIRNAFQISESDFNPNVETSSFYPKSDVPIVVHEDNLLNLRLCKWGVPPPPNVKAPIVNVRNLQSPFWRNMLANPAKRCLVPVTSFCEWYGEIESKKQAWFSMQNDEIFAFAGIFDEYEGIRKMAFLTCEPNELVAHYHPKAMPVILNKGDYSKWLEGDFKTALQLAKPFDQNMMKVG